MACVRAANLDKFDLFNAVCLDLLPSVAARSASAYPFSQVLTIYNPTRMPRLGCGCAPACSETSSQPPDLEAVVAILSEGRY